MNLFFLWFAFKIITGTERKFQLEKNTKQFVRKTRKSRNKF